MNEDDSVAGPALWRLPDGVDELLPAAAARVEVLRRRILDRCRVCGFDLVSPPLIEYLDALLTGTGEAMDLQTFKLVDQQDGRALGVRADMTPQVARLDAHALREEGPTRLCYTGTVLRARAEGIGASRNPRQFGAELYGHAGAESDIEICRLMLDTVLLAGLSPRDLTLDLGHVGVYAGLVRAAGLSRADEGALFEAMVRGSRPDVAEVLVREGVGVPARRAFDALPGCAGGAEAVEVARSALGGLDPRVDASLDVLERVIRALADSHPEVRAHVDLAELRGYRYHTGMLFAALDPSGTQLARGGRYDAVGAAFGRARPATGFSGDLERLAAADSSSAGPDDGPVLYAGPDEADGRRAVEALRADGVRVVVRLPGAPVPVGVRRELARTDGAWAVRPLNDSSMQEEGTIHG